jgi:hypothetical protein
LASLATDYRTQEETGLTTTYILRDFDDRRRFLGPIPGGDANTGTLTYVRPDDGTVTSFLAMTRPQSDDCVFGGTALAHPPSD